MALLGLVAAAEDGTWRGFSPIPGLDNNVLVMMPDGDGLLVGGQFSAAGGVAANRIARWDGRHWQALVPDPQLRLFRGLRDHDRVQVLDRDPASDRVAAGGDILELNGVAIGNVAIWDGSSWDTLAGGVNGRVTGVCFAPNGDLLVAGQFDMAGTTPAANIARWDGATWHPVGSGALTRANGFARGPGGQIAVFGQFPGVVAWWDPLTDTAMPTGTGLFYVTKVMSTSDGTWYAIGLSRVYRLEAGQWHSLDHPAIPHGETQRYAYRDLIAGQDGTWLVSIEHYLADGEIVKLVHRGTETGWQGSLPGERLIAAMKDGSVMVGRGRITSAGGQTSEIARWDGADFVAVGDGLDGHVYALHVTEPGTWYCGGAFSRVPGFAAANIARYEASRGWSSLGNGVDGAVRAIADDGLGGLLVGGHFSQAGGISAPFLAQYTAAGTWRAIPGSDTIITDTVETILRLPTGEILVGGHFPGGLARFDGVSWHVVPGISWHPDGSNSIRENSVRVLRARSDGAVVIGGAFVVSGHPQASNLGLWQGADVEPLAETFFQGIVADVALMGQEQIIIGGFFPTIGNLETRGIARWDGMGWHDLDGGLVIIDGTVGAVAVDPAGSIYATGKFIAKRPDRSVVMNGVGVFRDGAWHAMADGIRAHSGLACAWNGPEELLIGGSFMTTAGTAIAPGVAGYLVSGLRSIALTTSSSVWTSIVPTASAVTRSEVGDRATMTFMGLSPGTNHTFEFSPVHNQ